MATDEREGRLSRREVVKLTAGGVAASALGSLSAPLYSDVPGSSTVFSIDAIPRQPFRARLLGRNHHVGVDALLHLMAANGLDFYRSQSRGLATGPEGLIDATDIVLVKVNATWKYRGNTNSDVVRGIVQAILDHPDGFSGEVVVFENSQGWGSLACDTRHHYGDDTIQANANRPHHSFTYVIDELIADPRASWRELDPIRETFIGDDDHQTEGFRRFEDVSYPCFFTAGGHRVELKEGIWTGERHTPNLKLINVPVLKHHDRGGSEFTAAVKNVYGILSMHVGEKLMVYRHYRGLGKTCAKMLSSIRPPVLNVLDAIWVSHSQLRGYPAGATTRVDRLAASQDPLALDYWAAREVLFPIDENPRHHPDFRTIRSWMNRTRRVVNRRGGLHTPGGEIELDSITCDERKITVHELSGRKFLRHRRSLAG